MEERQQPEVWFGSWWRDYVEIAPHAERAVASLRPQGGICGMDHVAIRTFGTPHLGLNQLAPALAEAGYDQTGSYDFVQKRLRAASYSHKSGSLPRIFVSELLVDAFSDSVRDIIARCAGQQRHEAPELLWNPACDWKTISSSDYQILLAESEYAAWVGAYGLRVNHFTIGFDQLSGFGSLEEVNGHLQRQGFQLNGGDNLIQGSKERLLEQSSTIAEMIDWEFSDGALQRIRSCYVEFARRYRYTSGVLFDKFVMAQADTIFESTDMNRKQ